MSKEELIQFEGLVIEILPDARYRVQLDAGYEVVAYTAGKMKEPDQDSGRRSCDHRNVAL
jgi:translation initiation factor IF-1